MVILKSKNNEKINTNCFSFFGVNVTAQIGDLYIYNFSDYDIFYQLGAYNTNGGTCFPKYLFSGTPSPVNEPTFIIDAMTQQVYNGFLFPITNFPTPPNPPGHWNYSRKHSLTGDPINTSPSSAQSLSGDVISPYQARWGYFKWVSFSSNTTVYDSTNAIDAGAIGGTCNQSGLNGTNTTGSVIITSMVFNGDTIITIDNN